MHDLKPAVANHCQQDERRYSRRDAMGIALASGLVFTPRTAWGWQDASAREPLRMCIVSDTHLGYKDKTTAAERWEATCQELQRCEAPVVLHLGDVVDGGREAQYPIYRELRDSIKKPVHEIPGNHDPTPLFQKHLRKQVDWAFDHEWLRVVMLNNSRTDSHDGFLTDDQLRWLDDECRTAAQNDRYVFLAMHVPVHANRHPDRGWYVKPDQGQTRFYELVQRHRARLVALVHGHFHNGIRGWTDHQGLPETCLPSVLYNLDRKLESQQAPGFNLPEFRPGYTELHVADGQLQLAYKPTGESSDAVRRFALEA